MRTQRWIAACVHTVIRRARTQNANAATPAITAAGNGCGVHRIVRNAAIGGAICTATTARGRTFGVSS